MSNQTDHEVKDAETVKQAIDLGDFALAEELLLSVVANIPEDYANTVENEAALSIKFWELDNFLHFVGCEKMALTPQTGLMLDFGAFPEDVETIIRIFVELFDCSEIEPENLVTVEDILLWTGAH